MLFDDYLHLAHRIDRSKARRFCPQLHGVVIDVGCGRQPYREFLPADARYVPVENSPHLRPEVVGDVLALPFRDGVADGAMCNEVLEHVPEPDRAIAELNRILKPGGTLYVTVPQSWGLHYEPWDFFRYTRYGIAHLLTKNGFEIVALERMGGLFTFFSVRVIDMLVIQGLFPLFDRMRLRRGRYRLAALMVLPLNAVLAPLTSVMDRLDRTNAYGWAVLAVKGQ